MPRVLVLSGLQLIALLDLLEQDNLPESVRREVQAMVLEAAALDRHHTGRLRGNVGVQVRKYEQRMADHHNAVIARANEAVMQIPDDEWDRLVAEAQGATDD